ncbi:Hydroxypyruvate isomerase [Pirellula sp. SH-Sr6A]|nr:Hydroxypyruvate isomerase [Pirellula sp. SH-Sr6A]
MNTPKSFPREDQTPSIGRRQWLQNASAIAGGTWIASGLHTPGTAMATDSTDEHAAFSDSFRVTHRRIRQSVMGWCFKPMPESKLIDHCVEIGIEGIEGIDAKFYPEAVQKGLKIALVSSHGFGNGPTDRSNHALCIEKLKTGIDTAVRFGAPSVITFTGMRVPDMLDATADQNCLDCWKQVIEYAEEKKITLVLEHLNSRDDSHPMKGHPGYYGDDVDHCIDLVKKMDSPRFKLLFDIYHVQIMNGDIIRRIRAYHPWIGHYHTAGNPGRCEMDEHQEIYYPPILKEILATGYQGFVAQEFIPNWKDTVRSLRHGAWVMDVA